MNEIKIEKGIPVPEYRKTNKYPIRDMEVGDSILIPLAYQKTSLLVSTHGRRYQKTFICRLEGQGTRIWRVS